MKMDSNKDYYKEREKFALNLWMYAIQRIDILIIAISGGGIYIVLETIKFINLNKSTLKILWCSNLTFVLLKFSGSLFVISIIINIFSQLSGKKSNEYYIKECKEKQGLIDTVPVRSLFSIKTKALNEDISDRYAILTERLNIVSIVTMSIGILLLLILYFQII